MLLAHFSEWGMHMKHVEVIRCLFVGVLLLVESGLLHAEEMPNYECTTYTATAKLVKTNDAGQRYIDVNAAVKDNQYAKICFKDDESVEKFC